jgi:uncharacterized membrane protein YgcG
VLQQGAELMAKRATWVALGAATVTAVAMSRSRFSRFTKSGMTVFGAVAGAYIGAATVSGECLRMLLKLDAKTSPLKRQASALVFEWNPAYADNVALRTYQNGERIGRGRDASMSVADAVSEAGGGGGGGVASSSSFTKSS